MDSSELIAFDNNSKAITELMQREKRKKQAEEFKAFDVRQLLKMSSERLAEWQSEYEQDQPQWVLADQEWKRRGGISTRRIAIAAIVVSVLSLLVAAVGYYHTVNSTSAPPHKSLEQPAKEPKLSMQSPQLNSVLSPRKVIESTNIDSTTILQSPPN
jgi:hypothetical protein